MKREIFSCQNTLSVLPLRPDPSRNAPSVLSATVTDKLRSAPVTLLDQGDGAMPVGHGYPAPGSTEPQKIVGTPPRSKWSTEAGPSGGADPKKSGAPTRPRRAAGSQNGGSTPRGRRPTLGWLDGRGVSVTVNPPWRMGGGGGAALSSGGSWANPVRAVAATALIRFRRRHA